MKKILFVLSILVSVGALGQLPSKGYFRYDSVYFEKIGGNAEFILRNSTRSVTNGVLTNLGNGRTGFVAPSSSLTSLGSGYKILTSGVKSITATNGLTADSATAGQVNFSLGKPEATHGNVMDFTGHREISTDSNLVFSNKGTAFYASNPSEIRIHPINGGDIRIIGRNPGINIIQRSYTAIDQFPSINYHRETSVGNYTLMAYTGVHWTYGGGIDHHYDIVDIRDSLTKAMIQSGGVALASFENTGLIYLNPTIGARRMRIGSSAAPLQTVSITGSLSNTDSVIHENLVRLTDTTGFDVAMLNRTSGNMKKMYSGLVGGGGGGGSYTFSSPLSESGGTVSIADAAADGSTKGAASFTADDFNASSGNISIDYANGQKGNASVPGFIDPTDWFSFQNKQTALSGTGILSFSGTTPAYNTTSASIAAILSDETGSGALMFATSPTIQTSAEIASNDVSGGLNFKMSNAQTDGLGYGTIGMMGSTGWGVADWPNSFLIEGGGSGGVILSAYGGTVKFQLGSSRTTFANISNTGFFIGGNTAASAKLHILSTTEQARTAYDASNYYSTTVSSSGGVSLDAVGSGSSFQFNDAVNVKSGLVGVGGIYATNVTDVGNVGGGEDDLMTKSVDAGLLAVDKEFLEFTLTFTVAADVDIRVYFGATQLVLFSATAANSNYRIKGEIIRTGAATQKAQGEVYAGTAFLGAFRALPTETLSGVVVFKSTGDSTDGTPVNNDVIQTSAILKWYPAK